MIKKTMMTALLAFCLAVVPVFAYEVLICDTNPEGPPLYVALFTDEIETAEWECFDAEVNSYKKDAGHSATIIYSARPFNNTITIDQAQALIDAKKAKGLRISPLVESVEVGASVSWDFNVNLDSWPKNCSVFLSSAQKSELLSQQEVPLRAEFRNEDLSEDDELVALTGNKQLCTPSKPTFSVPYTFSPQKTLFLMPPLICINLLTIQALTMILTSYEKVFVCIHSLIEHDTTNSIWIKRSDNVSVSAEWLNQWTDHIYECALRAEVLRGALLQSGDIKKTPTVSGLLSHIQRLIKALA